MRLNHTQVDSVLIALDVMCQSSGAGYKHTSHLYLETMYRLRTTSQLRATF